MTSDDRIESEIGGAGPAPGMRIAASAWTDLNGVDVVRTITHRELRWLFREQETSDYGVDAHVEIAGGVHGSDDATGRLIALQIKSGESFFARPVDEGWRFRGSLDHLAYWLGHSLPVIVVIVSPVGDTYWQLVSPRYVKEAQGSFSMTIPKSQRLDANAIPALTSLAGSTTGLIESVGTFYTVLPDEAVNSLKKAADVDRLASAQLRGASRSRAGAGSTDRVGAAECTAHVAGPWPGGRTNACLGGGVRQRA